MARIRTEDGNFIEVEDLSTRDAATDDEASSAEWAAFIGGVAKRLRGNQLGGDTTEIETTLARVEMLIADMKLETPPFYEPATDAVLGLFDSRNTFDAAAINAYTAWSATPTIPANIPTLYVVARLPEDANPGDYRIKPIDGITIPLNGAIPLSDAALTGHKYYPVSIRVGGRGRQVGQTLILEQHGADIHTRFIGALVKDRIIEAIRELLLPAPSTGAAGQIVEINADRTAYQLVNKPSGSGSAALTTQLQQTIDNLVEKTLDLVIAKRPDWVLAAADKAQFTSIARGSTPAQNLASGQPPTGATGWDNDITLTSTRVLIVRIKATENLSDYRFLFDQPAGVTLSFSALTQYASDTDWVYYGENTLTNESTGRIRLQHHGIDVTSRFIGDLSHDKVLAALGDADTEGDEIARTAVLPTAAQTTPFTAAWTIDADAPLGTSTAGGILRILNRRPNNDVFGLVVSSYEGTTKIGETFFEFGAKSPDLSSAYQSYSAKPLSWSNGEVILVDYYHDNQHGDSIRLSGIGLALPANASVRVHLAVSANGGSMLSQVQDSPSGSGQSGIVYVSPSIIQLTQWIRSTGRPGDPGIVDYVSGDGTFEGFPDRNWSLTVPTGSDPLWMATGTLVRQPTGDWTVLTPNLWVITAEASSRIEFWNSLTSQWQAINEGGYITTARIWSAEHGWQSIPITGHNLVFDGSVSENAETSVPQVRLYEIDRLRFELSSGHLAGTAEISGQSLFGSSFNLISETSAVRNRLVQTAETLAMRIGTTGIVSVQRIALNSVNALSSLDGGILFNFYKTADGKLDRFARVGEFGLFTTTPNRPRLTITAISR